MSITKRLVILILNGIISLLEIVTKEKKHMNEK